MALVRQCVRGLRIQRLSTRIEVAGDGRVRRLTVDSLEPRTPVALGCVRLLLRIRLPAVGCRWTLERTWSVGTQRLGTRKVDR